MHGKKEEKDQRKIQLKQTLTKFLDRKEPNNEQGIPNQNNQGQNIDINENV